MSDDTAPSLHHLEAAIKKGDPDPHPRTFASSSLHAILKAWSRDDLLKLGEIHQDGKLVPALDIALGPETGEIVPSDVLSILDKLDTTQRQHLSKVWNTERAGCRTGGLRK